MAILCGRYWLSLILVIVAVLGCVARMVGPLCDAALSEPRAQSVGTPSEPNQLRWDLATEFKFVWDSVALSTTVRNASVDPNPSSTELPYVLSISLRSGVVSTEGVVTIDVNRPEILEVFDEQGKAIKYLREETYAVRCYEERGWFWDGGSVHIPDEWFPGTVTLALQIDPNRAFPSMISRLTGYVHAIYGDVIKVDVPFDTGQTGWMEFESAPDLLFRIDPSTPPRPGPIEYEAAPRSSPRRPKAPVALYKYETWVRSKLADPLMALHDQLPWYPRDVYPLGDYAIIRTELFESQSKTTTRLPAQWQGVLSDLGRSTDGGARCWGQTEQDDHAYDVIRHIIVVHPVEVRIPFVLRDIPVPSLPFHMSREAH